MSSSTPAGANAPGGTNGKEPAARGATRENVHRGFAALQATILVWRAQSTETAVAETWRLLRLGDSWVELAAFDCGEIADGEGGRRWPTIRGHAVRYVRSAEEALKAAAGERLGQRGYYLVPARLVAGREAVYDADIWSSASNGTAKESEATWSAVLCVDADPERPANTSATKEQWAAAVGVAGFVRETLLGAGLLEGALGLGHSGNGAHVHVYHDVTWSPEVKGLRERILRALGVLCHYVSGPTTRVKIDQTLADGARYIPLYGTLKRKGGRGHADRPWRKTALVGPAVVTPLDIVGLRRLADALDSKLTADAIAFWEATWKGGSNKASTGGSHSKGAQSKAPSTGASTDIFEQVKKLSMCDVAAFLGVDLSQCPRCGSQKGAGITKHPTDGIDLFHCFHDSCEGKPNWTNATLAMHVKGVSDDDRKGAFDAVAEVARHFGVAVPKSKRTKPASPSKEGRAKTFKAVMSAIASERRAATPVVLTETGAGPQPCEGAVVAASQEIEDQAAQEPLDAASATAAVNPPGGVSANDAVSAPSAANVGDATPAPAIAQDVDYDAMLAPVVGLDAIQQETVIDVLSKSSGLAKGALRKRLAELASERAAETEAPEKADLLAGVLEQVTFVEATNCRVFADVNGDIIPADSPRLKARIAFLYNESCGSFVGPTTIETVLAPMLGADIPHRVVPVRSGYGPDGSIWIDLGTRPQSYAHVTKDGVAMQADCPVSFYRPKTMAPMPSPVLPTSDAECKKVFEEARAHFQTSREQLASAFVWAVGALRPGEPHAGGKLTEYVVLLVTGPQGSGKTTFADSWSETVDPKVTPHFKLPRDDEALVILAENTRSLVFNNLSHIPQWTSDALCELADGIGMVLRSLYTSRDTTVFKGSNPVVLVSIGDVALEPDLLDRSLTIALPERTEYVEPEQVEAKFQELRPRLLGALLYCASRGLRDSAATQAPRGVRMAGAARWAVAAAPAGGFTREDIEGAFAGAIHEADEQVLDHPLVVALQDVLKTHDPWSGTTKDLLSELTASHEARTGASATKKLPKRWPESPQGLRSELRRLAKSLTRSGLTFAWPTSGGRGGRILSITRCATAELEPDDAPGLDVASRAPVESMPGMCVEDANGSVVGSPDADGGTMPGTMGTMPPTEGAHRSLEENRVGNDGNDGNDAFLSLDKEKIERPLEGGGDAGQGLLSNGPVEDAHDIVPIVPPFREPERRAPGGTMPGTILVSASAGIVPGHPPSTDRGAGGLPNYLGGWDTLSDPLPVGGSSPSVRARVREVRVERCPLAYLADLDVTYPNGHRIVVEFETEIGFAHWSDSLSPMSAQRHLEHVLTQLGWSGERDANGQCVVPQTRLFVRLEHQDAPGYGPVLFVVALGIEPKDQAA